MALSARRIFRPAVGARAISADFYTVRAAWAVAALEVAGVHFPFVRTGGLPPWVFVASGPVMLALGAAALAWLSAYVRTLARTLRAMLPWMRTQR